MPPLTTPGKGWRAGLVLCMSGSYKLLTHPLSEYQLDTITRVPGPYGIFSIGRNIPYSSSMFSDALKSVQSTVKETQGRSHAKAEVSAHDPENCPR
jgi:hypothetical protein